ncbi:MAG: hypothetical protein GY757_27735 [bacterium]|nr:hypothetical protein [bacterium]
MNEINSLQKNTKNHEIHKMGKFCDNCTKMIGDFTRCGAGHLSTAGVGHHYFFTPSDEFGLRIPGFQAYVNHHFFCDYWY